LVTDAFYLGAGFAVNAATGTIIADIWPDETNALVVGEARIAVVTDPGVLDLYGLPGS